MNRNEQRHAEEYPDGWREDPCGGLQGPGVARHREAHVRWADEEGSDEDEGGSYRVQEEARAGQEGTASPGEGGLQGAQGHLQAIQEVIVLSFKNG